MAELRAEILLAAYNGERFIRQQLDSILAQRDARWHLTVSDDGSADATPAILAEYAAKYPDRITLLRHETAHAGARNHFFHLMEVCEADYILFCDQDDVWLPDKITCTLDALLALEAEHGRDCPALAFCDLTVTDAQLRPVSESLSRAQNLETRRFTLPSILLQNAVTGCAMGINRALASLSLRCSDKRDIIMHDWWIAAVCARFGHIAFIDRPLILYRQHERNDVGAKDVRSMRYKMKRLSHLRQLRESILLKKRQSRAFLEAYGERLEADDEAFLRTFAKPHSGALFYLKNRRSFRDLPRLLGTLLFG